MKPIIPVHLARRADCLRQRGFTLVELMVAITLGMLIVAALMGLYVNVSRTNNEMAKANRQIENGRFAIQLLQDDLAHAGFWGEARPAAPTAIPDPCLAPASWDTGYKANLLAIPVQGFDSASVPASCGTVTGAQSNSDVVAVAHANTCDFGTAGCNGGTDTGPHLQVSSCTTANPPEGKYVIDSATFPLHDKNCTTVADRRKVVSNVYFVSGDTLMRTALENGAYTAAQPLIEGIQALRMEYGLDTSGDGSPDSYVSCAPCDLAQLSNVVAVKVHVLARNLEATQGYTDSKTYQLGDTDVLGPFDDGFKRHVFSATVRLVNPSARRETP